MSNEEFFYCHTKPYSDGLYYRADADGLVFQVDPIGDTEVAASNSMTVFYLEDRVKAELMAKVPRKEVLEVVAKLKKQAGKDCS